MRLHLRRLLLDESGQDLVEYMLLTTLIGIAAVVGVNALGDAVNFVYISWDTAMQDPAVVEVPDPVGAGS
jgi:Flp pilus assembly pilin Flp